MLKQKKEEAKQLEDTIEVLKSSFQKVNEEKIELLKVIIVILLYSRNMKTNFARFR